MITAERSPLHRASCSKKVFVVGKNFRHRYTNDKNYKRVKNRCYHIAKNRSVAHGMCDLKCSIPKQIPVVFHDVSNYDYHIIIKEPSKELQPYLTIQNFLIAQYL